MSEEEFKRDTKLNIHQRINAIMGEWGYVKKDKKITMGGGGFTVTGHDAVTALIHPLLVKHGVNIEPSMNNLTRDGNCTIVEMGFDWVNIDDPADVVNQPWGAYGIDPSDKGPGKAASYAQRFAVLKMLHIETGDKDLEDDNIPMEGAKIEHKPEIVKKVTEIPADFNKVSAAQVRLLGVKFKEFTEQERLEWIMDKYGVESMKDLPRTAVNEIVKLSEAGQLLPVEAADIPF